MNTGFHHRYVNVQVGWERIQTLHTEHPSCWCGPAIVLTSMGYELWHNDAVGVALGTSPYFVSWNLTLLEEMTT